MNTILVSRFSANGWAENSATVGAIGPKGHGFGRSLAALLRKGLESLADRRLEMRGCFFRDASRLRARQVMGLEVLMEGSPLAGEIS